MLKCYIGDKSQLPTWEILAQCQLNWHVAIFPLVRQLSCSFMLLLDIHEEFYSVAMVTVGSKNSHRARETDKNVHLCLLWQYLFGEHLDCLEQDHWVGVCQWSVLLSIYCAYNECSTRWSFHEVLFILISCTFVC